MILMLLAAICSQFVPVAETEIEIEMGTLLIDVVGFESSDGLTAVSVFTAGEWSHPPNPSLAGISATETITDLSSHFEMDIPLGEYVVLAFHDKNSNGQFDMEDETIGFSGNLPQIGSTPQPPSFNNLSIELSRTVTAVRIAVRKMERPERESGRPGEGGGRGGERPGGGGRPF